MAASVEEPKAPCKFVIAVSLAPTLLWSLPSLEMCVVFVATLA